MGIKQDIIFEEMLNSTAPEIAPIVYKACKAVKGDIESQKLIALAAALICLLQKHNINCIDVLNNAENIVFSGKNNNVNGLFKEIIEEK